MKNIKKLLSIVMVLAMVLSLGVQALAATVKLPSDGGYEGHTMVAYKIFEGAMNADQESGRAEPNMTTPGRAKLGVTGWASGVDKEGLLLELGQVYAGLMDNEGKDIKFNTAMSAVQAADSISRLSQTADFNAVAFSRIVAKHLNGAEKVEFENLQATLGSGYWIIIDESYPDGNVPDDFAYSAYLLEVVGNEELTLADKVDVPTVDKEVNDMKTDVVGLNEVVKYTITATLPQDYATYESYYLAFVDNMDNTLDELTEPSATIQFGKGQPQNITLNWKAGEGNKKTFTYEIKDLKDPALGLNLTSSDTIVLTFYAKVTDRTLVRTYNDAHTVFSNNPNFTGEGTPPTGTTPPSQVVIFTFNLDGNKVDGEGAPLPGAAFTLYKVKDEKNNPDDVFEQPKDGAEVNIEYNGETYTLYRNEVEAKQKAGNNDYEFDFNQLSEGKYLLVETTVPAGYNKAADYAFTIELTKDGTGKITGAVVKGPDGNEIAGKVVLDTPAEKEGIIPEEVKNTSGLELPETGGIGTTIFYVVGAILVVGAVILLVTRKRVSGAEK